MPTMPSTKDKFTLRFRTKKQAAEFRKLAKAGHYSLNEYILRKLESGRLIIGRTEHGMDVEAQFAPTPVDN